MLKVYFSNVTSAFVWYFKNRCLLFFCNVWLWVIFFNFLVIKSMYGFCYPINIYIINVLSLEIYRAIHIREPCDRFYFSFITWIIIWFFNFLFKSINLYIFSLILFKMYFFFAILLYYVYNTRLNGTYENWIEIFTKKLGLKGINTSIQKRLL